MIATNGRATMSELFALNAAVFGGSARDETIDAFSLEKAELILRERFAEVELRRYPDTLRITDPADVYGYGLVGDLPAPLPFTRLGEQLGELLPRVFFRLAGEAPETVTRLAYCPGSGADMASLAFAAGATVHITGDLKYHQAQAVPPGHCILDVGHFSLEEVMLRHFARDLAAQWGDAGPAIRYFPGTDPIAPLFPDGTTSRRTE